MPGVLRCQRLVERLERPRTRDFGRVQHLRARGKLVGGVTGPAEKNEIASPTESAEPDSLPDSNALDPAVPENPTDREDPGREIPEATATVASGDTRPPCPDRPSTCGKAELVTPPTCPTQTHEGARHLACRRCEPALGGGESRVSPIAASPIRTIRF